MVASEYQSPFWNESAYLNLHPDVNQAVFVGQLPSGLDHYLLYGAWEKRDTDSIFQEELYESRYSDVAEAIANRQFGSAFQHFLLHGQFEGRLVTEVGKDSITGSADTKQLSFWDEDTYLKLNPDVQNAVARGELSSGLNHYLEFGLKEKRNSGSQFNEYFYLNQYKDVAAAVNRGLFQNAFEHFLRFGQYELRIPNPELQQLASLGSANLPIDPITQMMPGQSENSSRLSTDLLSLLQQFVSAPQNNSNRGSFKSNNDLLMLNSAGTEVSVTINASNINNLLPSLQKIGFKTIASRPDLNFVEGKLPVAALSYTEALGTQGLLGVMPVYRPMTSKGSVTSQADFVHEVDRVRATLPAGYDGTGVKIGVMSDSYNNKGGAEADISSGDLPTGGVQVLQDFSSGGSDEGRAMLQLIHDLAPGSSLAFSSVYNGQADFAQQIRNLANPAIGNAKVLVDDIFYFAEPFYQDGAIAQAVNEVVTTRGVSYFSSAGNLQNQAYETTNFNASNDTYYAGLFHDFDPGIGVDTRQRITLNNNQRIIFGLQWDDPFYTVNGVDTDLNIYLLDAGTNTVIAGSINNNINNKTPYEQMVFTNTSGSTKQYDVLIELKSGPAPGRFKYINFGSNNSGPITSEYALNSTTITPHAAATNGMAVAAIPYYNQKISESFNSLGPTTILFNSDGTPKATPEVRQKPDMAAIDGTDTTFFGSDVDSNGFPNFFGTSAAAPHAAAVAALVLQANPAFTPSQVYERLKSTALDISSAGVDNLTGWGRINAYDAIFGSVIPTTLNFSDGLESGVLSLAYETNSTGAGRIQISSANSPAAGNYHVVMNTMLTNINANIPSLNEMTLRVNTAGFNNINLNFQQKEFSEPDHLMPTTFAGSSNSDGVALSVDGINWYRLFDLTGTNSINTYQNKTINLSTFAASNGLTLGSDVRIKFQQYNPTSGPTGGFAFDDISVTGTAANTSPAIALPGSPVNYTENDSPTIIDSSATVTDDSADFDTGTLTVDLIANGTADDRLAIQHQGNGVGQIGVDGRIVKYSGTQIGTYAGGIGIEPLVITFNSSATPTATQALLQNITYANLSQNPSTASRTVRFVLTDGDGGTSAPVTKTIDIVAINDAPILDLNGVSTGIDYSTTFNRGGSAIGIVDSTNLTITDNDSTNLSSATVTISNPLNGAAEVLAANTSGTNISANYTYDGTTGILTLSGSDTLANYQNVLRSVTYNNTFFLPNTTDRTINFLINDGSLNSAIATTNITVNSPPPINLGNTTNTITRPPIESVNDAYPDDIYQFNLTNNSQLIAELVNAGGNADLSLYDLSGLLLVSSQNPATQNERIEQSNLLPSTYYLKVYQGSTGQSVNYRLRITNVNLN